MSMTGTILKLNVTKNTKFSVTEGKRHNRKIFSQNNIFKNYTVFFFSYKGHYWEYNIWLVPTVLISSMVSVPIF